MTGRYQLEIKKQNASSYTDLGEYDYFSYYDRPIDIVLIAFGVEEAATDRGMLSIDNVVVLEP